MQYLLSIILLIPLALNAMDQEIQYPSAVAISASIAFLEQETYAPDNNRCRDVIYFALKENMSFLNLKKNGSTLKECRTTLPLAVNTSTFYKIAVILKELTIDTAILECVTSKLKGGEIKTSVTIPLKSNFEKTYILALKDDSDVENITLTVNSRITQ